MKKSSIICLLLLTLIICIGCKEKLHIKKVAEIRFRKSYHYYETMSEKELDSAFNQKPIIEDSNYFSSAIKETMNKYGLCIGNELNINKFDSLSLESDYNLKNKNEQNFKYNYNFDLKNEGFEEDNEKYSFIKLKLLNNSNLVEYKIKWELGYSFFQTTEDIIPGGNEEIILVNQNYFTNGDFFDVTILEVK